MTSTGGKAQRATSRRADLFDAVIESVGTHGFERASLRDIATRAGMSHAGLLRHFASKEALLDAALVGVEDRERAEIGAIIAGGATDREVFEALARYGTQDRMRTRHWLTIVVAASDPDHPAHDYFRQRHDRFRAQVAAFADAPETRAVGNSTPRPAQSSISRCSTACASSGSSIRRSTSPRPPGASANSSSLAATRPLPTEHRSGARVRRRWVPRHLGADGRRRESPELPAKRTMRWARNPDQARYRSSRSGA